MRRGSKVVAELDLEVVIPPEPVQRIALVVGNSDVVQQILTP